MIGLEPYNTVLPDDILTFGVTFKACADKVPEDGLYVNSWLDVYNVLTLPEVLSVKLTYLVALLVLSSVIVTLELEPSPLIIIVFVAVFVVIDMPSTPTKLKVSVGDVASISEEFTLIVSNVFWLVIYLIPTPFL